jgi:hypothetical protein
MQCGEAFAGAPERKAAAAQAAQRERFAENAGTIGSLAASFLGAAAGAAIGESIVEESYSSYDDGDSYSDDSFDDGGGFDDS